MNIFFCMPCAGFGGSEMHALSLIRFFASQGVNLTVFSPPGLFTSEVKTIPQVTHFSLSTYQPKGVRIAALAFRPVYLHRFFMELLRSKPDCIIFELPWPMRMLPERLLARLFSIPSTAIVQLRPKFQKHMMMTMLRLLSRCGEQHIAVSSAIQRWLSLSTKKTSLEIPLIRNSAPVHARLLSRAASREVLNSELHLSSTQPIFLTLSRLEPRKNVSLLIRAFSRLVAKHPEAILLIAGEGSQRNALTHLASSLRLEKNIHFLGFRKDRLELLAASDLLVLASKNEGTPLSLAEAQATGTPAIIPALEGMREMYGDSLTAKWFIPQDLSSLVLVMEHALAELPELTLQAACLRETAFTDDQMCQEFWSRIFGKETQNQAAARAA